MPGKCRPQERIQERINEYIEKSDLVVFLLWRRWGSQTGKYISGFEEEYELANRLNDKHEGTPEIILYFREVSPRLSANPDEQLKKVLDFRQRIESENKLLYKPYRDVKEWERLFRTHLTKFVMKNAPRHPTMEQIPYEEEDTGAVLTEIKPAKIRLGRPEWAIVNTPDCIPSVTKELLNPDSKGSEIRKIAVACDGTTAWAIVRRGDWNGIRQGGAQVMLYRSIDGGLSWSETPYSKLVGLQSNLENGTFIWDMAISRDDPDIIAVACADISASPLTQEVWISTDKGATWENTGWPPPGITAGVDFISAMDISADFGGRKIIVGTRDGSGLGSNNVQIMNLGDYGKWNIQDAQSSTSVATNPLTGDVLAAKFSPSFADDSTIIVVYCNGTTARAGTWLVTGVHKVRDNVTAWQRQEDHVEIRNPRSNCGDSPKPNEIITSDLELPCDFSGRNASLRRFYVSTDAVDRTPGVNPNRGVYRIDDRDICTLMDNTATFGLVTTNRIARRASSICYYGICASGKLLVGEVLGYGGQAAVLTWFTDSPTAHPIPCWYPALKPTTGAAGQAFGLCSEDILGYGNAQVAWSPDGTLAYVGTGSASLGPWATPSVRNGAVITDVAWPAGYVNVVPFDESAFGISRNNGETWNQLSLIDTFMAKLTDVAPSADGTTIYVASINNNARCQGFDSVWRSSVNPDVTSPLPPAAPIGSCWERILCHVTAPNCMLPQTDLSLLRLAPDKTDGQMVFWAAQLTRVAVWSPDFGDFWAEINPRCMIQDFVAEASTIIYFLSPDGLIDKMPYTGTQWSRAEDCIDSKIGAAHMIIADCEDKVLVGADSTQNVTSYPVSYSLDGAKSFRLIPHQLPTKGNVHVAFDPDFDRNGMIYISDDAATGGTVYRNTIPSSTGWKHLDMMNVDNGAYGNYHSANSPLGNAGHYGLVLACDGSALYSAHSAIDKILITGVDRTLDPTCSLSRPGICWDCLNVFGLEATNIVQFTLEPSSLRHCGSLLLDMPTMLYAIDNDYYANNHNARSGFGGVASVRDRGMLWTYIDHVVKKP